MRPSRLFEVLADVRPNEGRPLVLLLVHAFFKGISTVTFETAANTYYLGTHSESTLPWVYVLTAIFTAGAGLAYERGQRVLSSMVLLRTLLASLALAIAAFYALTIAAPQAIAVPIMVWKDAHNILINVEFWAVAGLLFDVRQGKRLFALIAAGDVLGGILAGLVEPVLVSVFGTESLLFVAFSGVILSLWVLGRIGRELGERFVRADDDVSEPPPRLTSLLGDNYLALLFGVSALCYLNYYVIDYVFFAQTSRNVLSPAALARFFGFFYAAVGTGNLLTTSLISGRMLQRYGVGFGLLALPVAMTLGTGCMLALGTDLPQGLRLFFLVVVITKGLEETLRVSFQVPSYQVLYQPLAPAERSRAQAVRESIVEPVSVGLSGVLLLVLSRVLHLDSTQLPALLAAMALAWVVVTVALRGAYKRTLEVALARRYLGGAGLSLDAESAAVLERGMASPRAADVIFSLQMLEQGADPRFAKGVVEAVGHPDDAVARFALDRVRSLELVAALDRVRACMLSARSASVRSAAVRAYCALTLDDALDGVAPLLDAGEPVLRDGAMAGLLRSGGVEGVVLAGTALNEMVASASAEQRRRAAQVIGDADIPSFFRPLRTLLGDSDRGVRLAAIDAAGRLGSLRLVDRLLAAMDRGDTREVASKALVAIGDPGIAMAEAACQKSRTLRGRLVSVYARIGTRRSLQTLVGALGSSAATDHAIFANLVRGGFHPARAERETLRARAFVEVEAATWALAASADLGDREDIAVLKRALAAEVGHAVSAVLSLLALLHRNRAMAEAKRKLLHATGEARASAVEALDNLLPRDLRAVVLPLVDDLDEAARLARLGGRFPQARMGRAARVLEIAQRPATRMRTWTRVCALSFVTGPVGPEVATVLGQAAASHEPAVQQTARSVASALDFALPSPDPLDALAPDEDLRTTRFATLRPLRGRMLLILEKVMILKSVALFAELPESMLADVAAALVEVSAPAGEIVVEQGALGTAMYVVVSGAMRLTVDGKDVDTLGPSQVFGELAALDPSPRTATVTATSDALLFRLEADVLYELMSDSSSFTRALVAALCRRLRDAQSARTSPLAES